MPAEWERHDATWLAWPYNLETWAGHLDGAEEAFAKIIEALTPHEIVELLVPSAAIEKRAQQKLTSRKIPEGKVHFHRIESGDVWIRDYGPIFIKRKAEIAYTKWIYNAYGNKYADLLPGNDVPNQMPLIRFRRFDTGIVLEGGSIDVNGSGTLLTTEACLLSPDRNPALRKTDIEQKLKDFLGVSNILWLGSGIAGDDTTGHIDALARFVAKVTVVAVIEEDPRDDNYKPLQENVKRLRRMKVEDGTPLTVIELPMPRVYVLEGRRMAATYANFYIGNGVVLVPIYGQPSDAIALAKLQSCFPDRKVLGIDSRELVWGYGSIHCATQQQPAPETTH
jgi:agmatine deiminase